MNKVETYKSSGRPKKCPECGGKLVHEIDYRGTPHQYDVWRCNELVENTNNPEGELICCWYSWSKEDVLYA